MKSFKAFIQPFETPQGSVKEKFELIFSLRHGSGREELIYLYGKFTREKLFVFLKFLSKTCGFHNLEK